MRKSTLFKVASQSILKNKMRTLLTMLGIVIGVGAVIVMVAVGHGARSMIETQISSLGTNLIVVMPGATAADVKSSRKVAVLGTTVAGNLFPDGDAVGAQIQLGHVPFTVVGVLSAKGQSAGGNDQDDVILVPYTTAQNRLSGRVFIGQIVASTFTPEDIPAAQSEIAGIMREAHHLGDGAPDDFTVRNQTEIAEAATRTTSVMTGLLAAIASISLLVGGIGIMNIMLVSVTERTREIGIRMAIGARGSDVLTQFLVESIVMSVHGGLLGLALGFGGGALLGHITGWTVSTPTSAVLIAVGFSGAVGVFFGYYPARKAAALNPIEALRYE